MQPACKDASGLFSFDYRVTRLSDASKQKNTMNVIDQYDVMIVQRWKNKEAR